MHAATGCDAFLHRPCCACNLCIGVPWTSSDQDCKCTLTREYVGRYGRESETVLLPCPHPALQVYEWIKEPKDGKAESLDAEPSGTGCTLPSQEGQPPGGGGQPPAEERDGGGEGEPQREEPAPVKKKRGRPPIGYIAPGEESPLAGMAVMVPTSVLHALESVHGPGKWLNGKVKVRGRGLFLLCEQHVLSKQTVVRMGMVFLSISCV